MKKIDWRYTKWLPTKEEAKDIKKFNKDKDYYDEYGVDLNSLEAYEEFKVEQKKWKEYQRTFAVRTLTGRIRRGPLSFNMVINTPIQSLAADIVVAAAVRLSIKARKEGKPWLQFLLQIHDDLTFLVPISELEEAIEDIVEAMLDYDAEFMNAPLSVEVETGDNLCDMEPVLTVSGDELGIGTYS